MPSGSNAGNGHVRTERVSAGQPNRYLGDTRRVRASAMIRVRVRGGVAVIIGTLVGALLFSPIGTLSNNVSTTATVGAVVGGVVAIGACSGWISVPTTGGIVAAVLFALLGTGCDDYSGLMSVPGFLVGMGVTWSARALVCRFGVRLLYLSPVTVVALLAIATAEPIWFLTALIIGFLTLTWFPDNEHAGTPCGLPKRHTEDANSSAPGTDPSGRID